MSSETPKAPSENFVRAFGGHGSIVVDCGFCGRTFFNYNELGCFDVGELEGLTEKAKAQPDKYIGVGYTISYGYLAGRQYVHGCPCNEARRYEDFIWEHRYQIADYLRLRNADNLRNAKEDAESANSIPETMED